VANLLTRLQTFLFGAAIGRAASESVTPVLEPVRQHAWEQNLVKVLVPRTAAEAVVKRFIGEQAGQSDASKSGVGIDRFGVLERLAQTYPALSELHELSNREILTPDQVKEVLARHGIPDTYIAPLMALYADILTPGELAAAIHRGLVPDPVNPTTGEALLRGEQPTPPFKVVAYPVYPIDAEKEAAGSGYDIDRLGVLVGLQGLPMGTHEAAQAYYKGIITHGDYIRAFNESNSRNEWAQAVLDNTRQIPTSRDFFENALRGHHTFEWAAEQAARHGMSPADAEIIYQNQGRPLNLHQITQALAWDAKYEPAATDNPDPWMQSILLGPVRPEFYKLNDALKYNLPSAFYFRALQEQGVLEEAEAETWYKRLGWPPDLAAKVAKAYAKPATGVAKQDPYIGKADTQLWTAVHKAYVKQGAPRAEVEPILTHLIAEPAVRAAVFTDWDLERQANTLSAPAA
jgi:hypothetical protein